MNLKWGLLGAGLLAAVATASLAQVRSSAPTQQGPAIDFDFVNSTYYQTGQSCQANIAGCVTTSRASSGYEDDILGNWSLFGNNVLRVTNKGASIEESRTNLVIQSSALTNVAWSSDNTTVTGGKVDPASGTAAALFVPSVANTNHDNFNASGLTLTAAIYTWSVFFKPSGYNFAYITAISPNGVTRYSAVFNLLTGAVTQTGTVGSPTNTASSAIVYSNGWVRASVSMIAAATATGFISFGPSSTGTPTTTGTLDPSFAGDGTSGVFAWIPQLELGAFATSPISTAATAVTRAADVVTVTSVLSFAISSSLFMKGTPVSPVSSGNQIGLSVDDGTLNNRLQIGRRGGTGNSWILQEAGGITPLDNNNTPVLTQNVSGKMVAAFAPSDQALYGNGTQSVTNSSGTPPISPTLTTIHVGARADGNSQYNGYVERIAVWPMTRLPNTFLQNITGLNWAANDNEVMRWVAAR